MTAVALTAADLLHLVDRAERGSLLAEEAVQLRAGIRALAAERRRVDAVGAAPVDHGTPETAQNGA
ncbi:hypothetical protein [Streptomyces sp. NBC_00932]|uniref:hypothetical protein n=1 Tax=Streptomyces sp. NBC_00932 TaxID=2903690 RepID=UPI0038669173|nr:hypothetical protein OG221_27635 [Streptomyces sp. NBC_00932]